MAFFCLVRIFILCSLLSPFTGAQQAYIHSSGHKSELHCTSTSGNYRTESTPSYRFSAFSYTQTETVYTATGLQPSPQPTYGLAYSAVSSLFTNLSTMSYGNWDPNSTATPTDRAYPYGQAAWSAMWKDAALVNFTRGIYSTTASPTPIPSSELVLPPPLYFQPAGCDQFPRDFILGVAGAAAQIEGAIADEGRGPASPDFTSQINLLGSGILAELGIPQIDSDFTATESYYLYKRDIDRLAAIGSQYYSFSISWTRILPFALPGTPVNSQGLQHYDDLINYAISKGVQPVVTLIHLDTPAVFLGSGVLNYTLSTRSYFNQNAVGYENTTFEDAFVHYGQIVLAYFADRVPIWITYNEPQNGAINGVAIDHVLKSHARLYHFYHDILHGKGKMSFKNGVAPSVPQDPKDQSHVAATKHINDLYLSSFLNPLALGKDYPAAYKMTMQDYVPLSPQDLDYMRGTIDFLAVDIYAVSAVYALPNISISSCAADNSTANLYYPKCVGTTEVTVNGWNIGYHPDYISYTTPTYLRTQLNWFWNTFRLPLMITETGLSTWGLGISPSATLLDDILWDQARSEFYLSSLTEVLKAIWKDGVDVMGMLMWSFIDNWEWNTFQHQFGLMYNNRTTQERSYKRSFFDVVDFVESRRMTR